MTALAIARRRFGKRPPAQVEYDADKDDMDARLAAVAARLSVVRRREAEYRRFRDEYAARRPGGDGRG